MKRILKIAGFGLLSLLLLSFLTIQLFGSKISRSVISGLNESLNTEISVEEVNVSMLRSFPNISVDLTTFTMLGSDGTPLLEADRLSCLISLSSLFGKARIKTIEISDGALQVFVDVDGNTNYQLLEYTPVDELNAATETTGETAAFAIDDARLENVEFIYENEQLGTAASALIYDANFQGDFGTEIYDMATQANAEIRFIDNGDLRLLAGQSLRIGANSRVNNKDQSYEYRELYLGIGGLNLRAEGRMQQIEAGWDMDLRLTSEESTLTDLLRLVPESYLGVLQELRSRGKFSLSGEISKQWTEKQQPQMDFRVTFSDGRISSSRMDVTAKDLAFVGEFSNGSQRLPRSSSFKIEKLSGSFGRDPFELQLQVDNFDDPTIAFGANGSFPLKALPGLLPEGIVDQGDGRIQINGLSLSGRYEDMLRPRRMARVKSGGSLAFEDAELEVNERQLAFPSGQLILRNNELEVDNFRFQAPGNDITFIGQATNFIPVLFADSLNTQDAELVFRALLQAEELDIDELLALAGPTEEEIEVAEASGKSDSLARKSVARRAQITDLLRGQFEANIKAWKYGEIEGKDFIGDLNFTPQRLNLRGQTRAMDGAFQLEGDMAFVENPRLEARLIADDVDINAFFEQSNNFGQEVLVADNLIGRLNSKIYIRAYFDDAGVLDYNRLLVQAGIGITDGELNNFSMLETFGSVLKAKDLERIRFSNLENYLEIRDQAVFIPAMFIQSSAMNMTVSGSHSFSHVMDYNIKVNAGQVLANKIARHDDELELLPARRRGFFNLYYSVTGNLENYLVETNKRKVKSAFEHSDNRKMIIQNDLEKHFNEVIRLVEEPQDWRDIPELDIEAGSDQPLDFEIQGGGGKK